MMAPFMFHDSVLLSMVVSSSMSNESLLSHVAVDPDLPFVGRAIRVEFPEKEFEWLDCSPLRLPLVPTRNNQKFHLSFG